MAAEPAGAVEGKAGDRSVRHRTGSSTFSASHLPKLSDRAGAKSIRQRRATFHAPSSTAARLDRFDHREYRPTKPNPKDGYWGRDATKNTRRLRLLREESFRWRLINAGPPLANALGPRTDHSTLRAPGRPVIALHGDGSPARPRRTVLPGAGVSQLGGFVRRQGGNRRPGKCRDDERLPGRPLRLADAGPRPGIGDARSALGPRRIAGRRTIAVRPEGEPPRLGPRGPERLGSDLRRHGDRPEQPGRRK